MTDHLPPRADEPSSQPPPGTVQERWWQRSSFKLMLGSIAGFWLPALQAFIAGLPVSRESLASATVATVTTVLAWLGVTTVDRAGLRRA